MRGSVARRVAHSAAATPILPSEAALLACSSPLSCGSDGRQGSDSPLGTSGNQPRDHHKQRAAQNLHQSSARRTSDPQKVRTSLYSTAQHCCERCRGTGHELRTAACHSKQSAHLSRRIRFRRKRLALQTLWRSRNCSNQTKRCPHRPHAPLGFQRGRVVSPANA